MSMPFPPDAISLATAALIALIATFFPSSTDKPSLYSVSSTPKAKGEPDPVEKNLFSLVLLLLYL